MKKQVGFVLISLFILSIISIEAFYYSKNYLNQYPETTKIIKSPRVLKPSEAVWSVTQMIPIICWESSPGPFAQPKIIVDNAENLHIVWKDTTDYQGMVTTDWQLFYKIWNATTEIWSNNELISTESDNRASTGHNIAEDIAENIHVVWYENTDYNGCGTDYDIFYKLRNVTTDTWTQAEVVSIESSSASRGPDIRVDNYGNVHVVWMDQTNYSGCGTDEDVFYKCWNKTTQLWGPIEVISIGSVNNTYPPSLSIDGFNNVHVSWSEGGIINGSIIRDIFYRFWNSSNGDWSSIEKLSTDNLSGSFGQKIEADQFGNVHVIWCEMTLPQGSQYDEEVWYRFKNGITGLWSPSEKISQSVRESLHPSMKLDSLGNVHVTWDDFILQPGWKEVIVYRMNNFSTGSWSPIEIVTIMDNVDAFKSPVITTDKSNNVYVTWNDETNIGGPGWDLFYKKFAEPPDTPVLNEILPNPTYAGIISLTWNEIQEPGSVIYYIFRDTSNITSIDGLSPIFISSSSNFTDIIVTNGIYYYVIVAATIFSNSSISNCRSVEVDYRIPDIPILEPISPSIDEDGKIKLNWNIISGATYYRIYRDTSIITSTEGLSPIAQTTSNNFQDTIRNNGTYYYVIIAVNEYGVSDISNCESVIVAIPPLGPEEIGWIVFWTFAGITFALCMIGLSLAGYTQYQRQSSSQKSIKSSLLKTQT